MSRENVGKPWFKEDEDALCVMIEDGENLFDICEMLGRNERGIMARASRLQQFIGRKMYALFEQAYYEWEHEGYPEVTSTNLTSNGVRMKNNATWTLVSLLQDNLRTVQVKFNPSETKTYTFKTRDESIQVDDFVVVNPGLVEDKFTVGQVYSIDSQPSFDPDSGLRYHWIVAKIELAAYRDLVELDEKAYNLLVEAEKHVQRKKMVDLYTEALGLEDIDSLKLLLGGTKPEEK